MSYSDVILATAGLVSYWHLDETVGTNAADAAGSTPMTYAGTFTLADPGFAYGTSVLFNGSTGKATAGSSPVASTTNMSVEAWFKCTDLTPTRQAIVFNGDGAANGFGPIVNGDAFTNGELSILYGAVAWHNPPSTFKVVANTWYHIVVTIDGSSAPRTYINGSLLYAGAGATMNTPGKCSIGTDLVGFFKGNIDEVALYNVQLSAETILQHYLAGAPRHANYHAPKPTISSPVKGRLTRGLRLAGILADGSGLPRNAIGQRPVTLNAVPVPSRPERMQARCRR